MHEVPEHQGSSTDSSATSLGSNVTACKKVTAKFMLYSKVMHLKLRLCFLAFVFSGEYEIQLVANKEEDWYRNISSRSFYGILQFCLPGLYLSRPKRYCSYMGEKLPCTFLFLLII